MLLKKHIEKNHESLAEFARSISTPKKKVAYQQVQSWINQGCVWLNSGVYQKKNKG